MDNKLLTVAQAEAKLAAAKKRVFASHRLASIAAYERQASNPVYDGQAEICQSKAAGERSLYEKEMAEADLIEAKASEAEK